MRGKRKLVAAVLVISLNSKTKRKRQWMKSYLRMDDETYMELLHLITILITKQDTRMRKAISADERLAVTLRYLAAGRTLEDLKFFCAIAPQSWASAGRGKGALAPP
jgi:hypothetical protein